MKAPLHSSGHAFLTTWGCAPNPRRPLAGTPSPRAASAAAHCVRHYHLGLRPKPPAAASGEPFAPRRVRRGALYALSAGRLTGLGATRGVTTDS